MNWLVGLLWKFMEGKLNGYKTIIGGAGLVITGIGTWITAITMVIRKIFPDQTQFPEGTTDAIYNTALTGSGLIASGFGVLGVGHKMTKQTDAINTQTTAIVNSVQANTAVTRDTECKDQTIGATAFSPEEDKNAVR